MTRKQARIAILAATAAIGAACQATAPTDPTSLPGNEVSAPRGLEAAGPFPIDRGDDGAYTPGTYKGLWLRLYDNGAPVVTAVDGVIGVVCVGMSNANQECGDYINRLSTEYATEVTPAIRVVNCAVGGHAIERWNDPAYDGTLWDDCVTRKLAAAGVRLDQVRVIYHKAANQFTTGAGGAVLPTYPAAGSDYANFMHNLGVFASRVKDAFPAVQAVYTTSRSYGGFAGNDGRGEPLSYEEGHALNSWLAANPMVDGAWYGWGPYIWAPSCTTSVANGSGACYDREDFVADGVHPAGPGRAKVSAMLHARFLRESWYHRTSG
jgi:hypothetical protein